MSDDELLAAARAAQARTETAYAEWQRDERDEAAYRRRVALDAESYALWERVERLAYATA